MRFWPSIIVTVLQISLHIPLLCAFNEDPYRWVPTHGKPTTQTSTNAGHLASYATDGDYNMYYAPLNYSQTTISSNPYLQVDMGKITTVGYIVIIFPYLQRKLYKQIKIMLSDTPDFTSNHIMCYGVYDTSGARLRHCGKWGRYLTIQSVADNVELSVVELAAHRFPIENIALNKATKASSLYGSRSLVSNTNDGKLQSMFVTSGEIKPWIRVDLDELYYIHEVVLWLRPDCCSNTRQNIGVKAGRVAVIDDLSNRFCGSRVMYQYEIRSYYCKVVGRYVILQRMDDWITTLSIGEIIVNPETTDNIAIQTTEGSNTAVLSSDHHLWRINDGFFWSCTALVQQSSMKKIWIQLRETHDIYKVLIVNNFTKMHALVDFEIKIGAIGGVQQSCVDGLHSMVDVYMKAFYCEPRISGREINIIQTSTVASMSICEVAVYSESKPEIDRSKDYYVWVEENSNELRLTCEAKGFPSPTISWLRNGEIYSSNIFELKSLTVNHSGEYECWANNTHGADVKVVDLLVSSSLRVCADFKEIPFLVGTSENDIFPVKGNEWYHFFDPRNFKTLQISETPLTSSKCQLWMKEKHPGMKDGVVTRTLCFGTDCSTTYDVYVRRCSAFYIYNLRDLRKLSSKITPCFTIFNRILPGEASPAIVSVKYDYLLPGSVFHTETQVTHAHNCFIMCHISTNCRSINFSETKKICELNSSTDKEKSNNVVHNKNYNYYQLATGIAVNTEL